MQAPRLATWFGKTWLWSFVAAALAFVISVASAGHGAEGLARSALTFGAFYVVVGLGQMFVITLGPGNIDLSVPSTIALAGCIAMKAMDGSNAAIPLGCALALLAGAGVGLANAALIFLLRIPPIIATLSASFVIQSLSIEVGRGLLIRPPSLLGRLATAAPADVPVLAVVAFLLALLAQLVLARTVTGRTVLAIGQNRRAARLAGLPVTRTAVLTYMGSGVAAAACGILLASYSGGAALDMGTEYLLASIAVVVIGGTAVAGGQASVAGVWGASLFLFLLVSTLSAFGLGAGGRTLLTGLIIIAVVAAAGGK